MPRRNDIKSVMVIGSGPIVIGQACEFDYSGTQACRVLKAEGMRVVLVNSNPATIMTDPEWADATYIEPITPEVLTTIIEKERPDALLATLGGQTALNAAVTLEEQGVLEKYHVELIGMDTSVIHNAEDRQLFKDKVESVGGESARSVVVRSVDAALDAAQQLGYPMVVRPSFTMGGLGSGMAYDEADLRRIVGAGLHYSLTGDVLLEESVLGWKEIELEVVRDETGKTLTICSIENVDPMGVHTGDSITLAPAVTLTDTELAGLIELAGKILTAVGVKSGGCNLQFAVDPKTGRVVVIEMNPRVSRSSALASKATGFPIAKVVTKLALGYHLNEITNDLTGAPIDQDPAIDYIVVKVPRFAFEKFPAADATLTTTMKSVGEAMALGRNFTEALGKALRSIDQAGIQFHWDVINNDDDGASLDSHSSDLLASIATPYDKRLVDVQQLLRHARAAGRAPEMIDQIYAASGLDPWFLRQIDRINEVAAEVAAAPALTHAVLANAKRHGLSDRQIAALRGMGPAGEQAVREVRHALDVVPIYKAVDTCAGQLPAKEAYMYSAYETPPFGGRAPRTEVQPRTKEAMIILGSGPNRIGQGLEFDYSCVHATLALAEMGYEAVMVNCNPETVSTDYDISDRLYFEPLTFEDVYEVYLAELAAGPVKGMIVQLGGQTPLALAQQLADAGVPILGTTPEAIDAAEDRGLFGAVLAKAGLKAPEFGTARTLAEAKAVADRIGYPVLVRPSYVLGGRGMEIVYHEAQLVEYVERALAAGRDTAAATGQTVLTAPLLIDRFLDNGIEIDVDALYDGAELYLAGVMEHIEEAGIHSGDSACVLPPVSLSKAQIARIKDATEAIAREVGVRGLINVQYALAGEQLYVLEANPRASRTVPFVAKATGVPLASAAAEIMVGRTIAQLRADGVLPHDDATATDLHAPIAVKEAVLPFRRFRTGEGTTVDTILGPEMRSTGEVMGFDQDFPRAFAKSQAAAYGGLPKSGTAFISVADKHKRAIVFPVQRLHQLGFKILATEGTAQVLARNGIPAVVVRKHGELGETIVDLIDAGQVDLVVNTPAGGETRAGGYAIRAATTANDKSLITTIHALGAAVQAIEADQAGPYEVGTIQAHTRNLALKRAA